MAALDRAASLEIIGVAYDAGITHFDVARSYGYGEAEAVLGEFTQGRRDRVTISTKFGIAPPSKSVSTGPVKQLARGVARALPFLRPLMRGAAAKMVQAGNFDVPSARASLDTSLRMLRTDYVDYLMLHECTAQEAEDPSLLEFLAEVKAAGKVKTWGVGVFRDVAHTIYLEPEPPSAVQIFDDALLDGRLVQDLAQKAHSIFTHSAIGPALPRIMTYLAADASRTRRWTSVLGQDCSKPETIARLLLAEALRRNPTGTVLYSSRNPQRVRDNTTLAHEGAVPRDVLEAFVGLLAESGLVQAL